MVAAVGQWHAPDVDPHASRPGDGQLHGIAGPWEQDTGDRDGRGGVHGTVKERAVRDDWTRLRAGPSCTAPLNANDVSSCDEIPAPALDTMPEPRSARRAEPGTTDRVGRSGHPLRTQQTMDWASSTAVLEALTFPATEPRQSAWQYRSKSRDPSTRSPSIRRGRPLHSSMLTTRRTKGCGRCQRKDMTMQSCPFRWVLAAGMSEAAVRVLQVDARVAQARRLKLELMFVLLAR